MNNQKKTSSSLVRKLLNQAKAVGEPLSVLRLCFKWLLLCVLVGLMAGSASAFFLVSLRWVTAYRESHTSIIWLLPLGGLAVGLLYHYYGGRANGGTKLLQDEIQRPRTAMPLLMAPLVLFGTLVTHLFGGSAGREGTAMQMGGALADQLTYLFRLRPGDRQILILTGISAGFASLFGTPMAGALFGLEAFLLGRLRYKALLPSLIAAIIGHYTCLAWGVGHMHFSIPIVPALSVPAMLYAIAAGAVFGLAGMAFSKSTHLCSAVFRQRIQFPPLRPLLGGAVIALSVWLLGTTKYIGLGLPTILAAFQEPLPWYDWLVKTVLTAFTLGAGFKGGEVTPLFYVGATLGNLLAQGIPLPMALLAGMGLVAVFTGATNTPLSCIIMAVELFGSDSLGYMTLACITAYFFSGRSGIYGPLAIGSPKQHLYACLKRKRFNES